MQLILSTDGKVSFASFFFDCIKDTESSELAVFSAGDQFRTLVAQSYATIPNCVQNSFRIDGEQFLELIFDTKECTNTA